MVTEGRFYCIGDTEGINRQVREYCCYIGCKIRLLTLCETLESGTFKPWGQSALPYSKNPSVLSTFTESNYRSNYRMEKNLDCNKTV